VEENLETIRAFYEAYNRRDFDHLPKPLHPDIELLPAGDQAPIKGAARVRASMEPDAFDSQVIELLDLRVVGDKVLVRARTKIRGAGSGIETEFLFWAVWTFDKAGITTPGRDLPRPTGSRSPRSRQAVGIAGPERNRAPSGAGCL
jgi:ketosteroid isomerase-like protein